MGEQEWLSSEDPQAMLRAITCKKWPYPTPPSDRKLRLFAAACYRGVAANARGIADAEGAADGAEYWAEHGYAPPGVRELSSPQDIHDRATSHAGSAASWAQYHRGVRTPLELSCEQAHLLRDIVGNPFRPVTLSSQLPEADHAWHLRLGMNVCRLCGVVQRRDGLNGKCRGPAAVRLRSSDWLTPTVVGLAQAAYEERVRECDVCKGDRIVDVLGMPYETEDCRVCHGTGAIDDGTLDPFRLAVLADALEEAGCDNEGLLRHLRGEEMEYTLVVESDGVPHAVQVGWKPLRGPHVRGCWAIDLILGKE